MEYKHWPILSNDDLITLTHNLELDEDTLIFHSSGVVPKKIPYSEDDLGHLVDGLAEAFSLGGLTEEDTLWNHGAPIEVYHMSAWGGTKGAEAVGATVANNAKPDAELIFSDPDNIDLDDIYRSSAADAKTPEEIAAVDPEDVTAIFGLPRDMKAYGEDLAERYGDLEDVFPNMRLALTSGDRNPPSLREALKDIYGVEEVCNFYAAVEFGAAGTEDTPTPNDLVPVGDNLAFEVFDDQGFHEYVDDLSEGEQERVLERYTELGKVPEEFIYSFDEIDGTETGALLISADREALPLRRYRVGDKVEVCSTPSGPRMSFKGRERSVLSMAGAMLYPQEIERAINNVHPNTEWRVVASEEDDYPALDIYLVDADDAAAGQVVEELYETNYALKTLDDAIHHIDEHYVDSLDELEEELMAYELDRDLLATGPKAKWIAKDESYTG